MTTFKNLLLQKSLVASSVHFLFLGIIYFLIVLALGFAVSCLLIPTLVVIYLAWSVYVARSQRVAASSLGTRIAAALASVVFALFLIAIGFLLATAGAILTQSFILQSDITPPFGTLPVSFAPIVTAILLVLPVLSVFALVFLRNRDTGYFEGLRRLGHHTKSLALGYVGLCLLSMVAMTGLIFLTVGTAVQPIAESLSYKFSKDLTALFFAYPSLIIGLLGGALSLALYRAALGEFIGMVMRIMHADDAPERAARRSKLIPFCAAFVVALCLCLYASYKPLHDSLTAAGALIGPLGFNFKVLEEIDNYIKTQADAGVPVEKYVDELARHGHWQSSEPDKGLTELIAALRPDALQGSDAELSDDLDCDIVLQIAPLPEEERAAVWRFAMAKAEQTGKSAEEIEVIKKKFRPAKYCLRSTCTSSIYTGSDYPVTVMASSHAGDGDGWAKGRVTLDAFFGQRYEDSGFCTRDGKLADKFHGG